MGAKGARTKNGAQLKHVCESDRHYLNRKIQNYQRMSRSPYGWCILSSGATAPKTETKVEFVEYTKQPQEPNVL